MASMDDQIKDIDRRVADSARQVVDQLKHDLLEAARRASREAAEEAASGVEERLQQALQNLEPSLPGSLLPSEAIATLTRQAAEAARREARQEAEATAAERPAAPAGASFGELRQAAASIDRGRGQSEILDALVREATRFADRSVLVLLRGGTVAGWTAQGFDVDRQTVRALSLDPSAAPWAAMAEGGGPTRLEASDCAAVASGLDSPLPKDGVAIPMVLRDKPAAVLYADRTKADSDLGVDALQTLVYLTALALESLSFRERESTQTLEDLPGGDEASVDAATPTAPTTTTTPDDATSGATAPDATSAETTTSDSATDEPTATTAEAASAAGISLDAPPQPPAPPAPAEADDAPDAPPAAPATDAGHDFGAVEFDATPAPAVESDDEAEIDLDELSLDDDDSLDMAALEDVALEDTGTTAVEDDTTGDDAATASGGGIGGFDDFDEASLEEAPEVTEEPSTSQGISWQTEDGGQADAPQAPTPEAPPAPEPPRTTADDAARTTETPTGGPASAGAATQFVPTSQDPQADTPTPATPQTETPSPAEPAPGPDTADHSAGAAESAGGGQVQPPEDVQGPGRAFASESDDGDDAAHEEARRLARLLVSEIQLYFQDEVEEGRRNRDIYDRLREDIDRARQLYEERVDASVRSSRDYFYDELVRQLGGGDAKALGI